MENSREVSLVLMMFFSQNDRLRRMISHWKSLSGGQRELICIGDANICAFKWNDDDYNMIEPAELVQDYLLESCSAQIIDQFTRSEIL